MVHCPCTGTSHEIQKSGGSALNLILGKCVQQSPRRRRAGPDLGKGWPWGHVQFGPPWDRLRPHRPILNKNWASKNGGPPKGVWRLKWWDLLSSMVPKVHVGAPKNWWSPCCGRPQNIVPISKGSVRALCTLKFDKMNLPDFLFYFWKGPMTPQGPKLWSSCPLYSCVQNYSTPLEVSLWFL